MPYLARRASPLRQRGTVALVVTIMITLIAIVASVYAAKNSVMAQKSTSNAAQNLMAMQAAEDGLQVFEKQIRDDLAAISGGAAAGVILEKDTGAAASTSCTPGSASLPYMFTATYRNGNTGADKLTFGADKYFDRPAAQSEMVRTVDGVNMGLNYKVQAKMVGRDLFIVSTGVAAGKSEAVVRKQVELQGGLSLGDSALTVGSYYDSATSNDITANAGAPKPKCAVLYGDNYAKAGSTTYTCQTGSCPPTQSDSVRTKLFEQVFGKSKAELKASLPAIQIVSGCNNTTIAGIPNKYLWIEGDAKNCIISGTNSAVIINGNIVGGIKLDGFVYAANAYLDGASDVTGSVIIENAIDVAPLGTMITHIGGALAGTVSANTNNDAADPNRAATHSAQTSFKITYKTFTGNPDPNPPSTSSISGSWIDF